MSGEEGRPRTEYDRLVMQGLAPHVPGGNPTQEERERQEALARLVERNALSPQEEAHREALDAKLASRDAGWVDDRTVSPERDKLIRSLIAYMDGRVSAYRATRWKSAKRQIAHDMIATWERMRKELDS